MEAPALLRCRGVLVPDDPAVIGPRTRRLLRSGDYEAKEADAVRRLVRHGETVLEVGAGIGFMSSHLVRNCGADRVVSFEANPRLIPFIARVHAATGVEGIEVRNAVLSPEDGPPLAFHVRAEFDASSLDPLRPAGIPVVAVEAVPRAVLGEAFEDVRPDVLVCDIEGAEADLVPHMPLDGLRLAVLELHPQWIGKAGVRAVFEAMDRGGLTYFPKASHAKVVAFRRDW